MKIQCDVCSSSEASVFCSADEAALCDSCDYRVHHANKLASKHQRFSLVSPNRKDVPLCDICKENWAFLFCQQDRAILCKNCDFSIHNTNAYTQKHNRFLLTGIQLSTSVSSDASETSLTSSCDLVPDFRSRPLKEGKSDSVSMIRPIESLAVERVASPSSSGLTKSVGFRNDVGISEYLIEMLPGWHVEDLHDPTSAPCAFSKGDNSTVAVNHSEFQNSSFSSFPLQNAGYGVPQAPQTFKNVPHFSTSQHLAGNISYKEPDNKKWAHEGITVPQLSPHTTSTLCKRSRLVWF